MPISTQQLVHVPGTAGCGALRHLATAGSHSEEGPVVVLGWSWCEWLGHEGARSCPVFVGYLAFLYPKKHGDDDYPTNLGVLPELPIGSRVDRPNFQLCHAPLRQVTLCRMDEGIPGPEDPELYEISSDMS